MGDAEIYKRDAPGVVEITATTTANGGFFGQTTTSQALGSGFVLDKAGHIVTNYHVIAGAQKVQVSFTGQDQIKATVVGKDATTDLAVLKIDAHARALTPLGLADSSTVEVGQSVVAIGNPFGLTRTLTAGVVSAVERHISSPNQSQEDAIQTDASINHGNSGGPLIDMHGQVIGVTSQIETGTGGNSGNVGIGFAIPSNTVRTVVAQLITTGKALHAYLGVDTYGVTKRLARTFNLPVNHGVLVQTVTPESAAAKAGIVAGHTSVVMQGITYELGGDIITSVDGQAISTPEDLLNAIANLQPGDKLSLDIYRHGKEKHVTATLGNRPQAGP
jgi:S1-C subfamily serine protease